MLGRADQGGEDGIALLERRHAGDARAISCLQPGARQQAGSGRLPAPMADQFVKHGSSAHGRAGTAARG